VSCETCKVARGFIGGAAGILVHEATGIAYIAMVPLTLSVAVAAGVAALVWGPNIFNDPALKEENSKPPNPKKK
jgi:hypothetical protein